MGGRASSAALVVAFLVAACGGETAPMGLDGVYRMASCAQGGFSRVLSDGAPPVLLTQQVSSDDMAEAVAIGARQGLILL